MDVRIDRAARQYIDPRLADHHLAQAITDGRRFVVDATVAPGGTIFRIYGYARGAPGLNVVTFESPYGCEQAALLEVVYVDRQDAGLVLSVLYAFEASEEEFYEYG